MEKWSLKENGKNENICFKIYICKKSITYFVPQMMAAGTGMAGDVAAMAASASVHSQPMAPGDMQVWQSGFLFWLFSALSSLSQLSQEEGDRKTNLIVNYLPQTMTQVRRSPSSEWRPILSNLGLELPLLRKSNQEKGLKWNNPVGATGVIG